MPLESRADLIASAVTKFIDVLRSSYDEAKGSVASISLRQELSRLDKGPSSRLWTVPVEFPKPPEDDAEEAVRNVAEELRPTRKEEATTVDYLKGSSVQVEWISNKRNKGENFQGSEAEMFERLTRDVTDDMVTIYVHGGAYFLNGLGTSRAPAARLSATSNGRVLTLDYRLAPQSPFPSPILDLLIAYLTLIYPPPGSLHAPIPASRIIFAGESSGANICLGVVQVIRHLNAKHQPMNSKGKIRFHGQLRHIPMPAGLALLSIAADYTYSSLPSWASNAAFDIWYGPPPYLELGFPIDDIWPSKPPRADPYCSRSDLVHPLVSPCLAQSWEGSCPMWIAEGEEQMLDGARLVAKRALEDGVRVTWEEYERMPHSWPLLLPMFPQSRLLWERWGKAARVLMEGKLRERNRAVKIGVEDLEEQDLDLENMTSLTYEEARSIIWDKMESRGDFVGKERDKAKL